MLSEIKKKPGWERLVRLNQTFREVLWGVCKSKKLRSCLSLCGVRGSRPAGISRWAQVKKKKSELTAISRPEPVCFVWSWHPPLLRNATLCAPRFASVQTFYAQSGRLGSTTIRSYAKETEKKPGKDLSALLFLLCTVWVEGFSSSSSNLTDVTGCVLPNPELCVSGNGAQLPPGGLAAAAATPAVRCAQQTAQTSKTGVRGTFRGR